MNSLTKQVVAVLAIGGATLSGIVLAQNKNEPVTPQTPRDAASLPSQSPESVEPLQLKPGYKPSTFPGVMVRQAPNAAANGGVVTQAEAARAEGQPGWVYVKPGATPPARRSVARSAASYRSVVKKAGDGVQLEALDGGMSESVAQIGPNGKLVVKCRDGARCAHPQHKAQKAGKARGTGQAARAR